jgi:PIN domain nuclease of toxin-antitoxin system
VIVLVDANALLWWANDDPKLSEPARRTIADPSNAVLVSAATIWEIEIKRVAGRLDAPPNILEEAERQGFDVIPLTGTDAVAAANLPEHHRDPFDRLLIAQALRLEAIVISRDRAFAAYGVHQLVA